MATSLDESVDSSIPEPSSLATESTVESSFDQTQESAVTESQSNTDDVEDEDEDDELLALRIAALESIKLKEKKESKPPEDSRSSIDKDSSQDSQQTNKPDFVRKKHPARGNLVSIVTGEEETEIDYTKPPPNMAVNPPLVFNYPPPSPIGHRRSPDFYRYNPPPGYRSRSRSRSFERRRSISPRGRYYSPPRRYSSLSPPPYRRSPDRRITPTRRLTPTRQLSPTARRLTPPSPNGRRPGSPPYDYDYRRRSPGGRMYSPPPGRRSPPPYPATVGGQRRSPYSYNKRHSGGRGNYRGSNFRREPFKPRSDNRQQHRKSYPDKDGGGAKQERPVSESEWETDTDPPTDDESVNNTSAATAGQDTPATGADKSQDSVKASEGEDSSAATDKENTSEQSKVEDGKEPEKSKDKTLESEDGKKIPLNSEVSHDDVLKLDASAEVDEFSKFLNEFEEEILNEKKVEEKKEETSQKTEKKSRIQTERKTVDGKKMRKKIKPKRDDTLSFSDEDSHPPGKQHRSSQSPGDRAGPRDRPGLDRGSGGQNRYSKDRPRFSAERGVGRDSRGRDDNNRGSRPRDADSRPQQFRETSSERRERERKEYEERKEKEKKEYEERLAKLPSPEREKMEARRRKFEARGELELDKPKKISLKRDTVDTDSEEDARSKLSHKRRDGKSNLQATEKSDNRRRERSLSPPSDGRNKQHVTDLRVQLHKKKQLAARVGGGDEFEKSDRKSADRSNARKSAERNGGSGVGLAGRKVSDRRVKEDLSDYEDLDLEDERVPPITSTHRVIMPPMFMNDKEKGKEDDGEASDRSPSPPNKGGRRVKIKSSSLGAEEELDAAKFGFTEEELQREMKKLQRKNKKKEKKEKKEKKRLKKKKKSSKSKLDKIGSGSEEEGVEKDDFMDELDHFEKMLEEGEDFRSRSKSGSRNRNSSGEKSSSSRSRHSSSLSDEMKLSIRATSAEKWKGVGDSLGSKLKQRLGHKVKEAKVETELEPLGTNKRKLKRKSRELQESDDNIEEVSPKLSKKNKKRLIQNSSLGQLSGDEENDDLIAKMAKKNKKRLERAKEIERDRQMYS